MITLKRSIWLYFILVCFSCALPPAPDSQGVTELKMPKAIVDLSPTVGEDLPAKALGVTALEALGIPPTTKFELKVTEEPFYVAEALIMILPVMSSKEESPPIRSHSIDSTVRRSFSISAPRRKTSLFSPRTSRTRASSPATS
jgi:hypothetical protein